MVFATAKTPLKEALYRMKRTHEYKVIILDQNNIPSHVLTHEEIIRHMAEQKTK